MKKIIFMLMMVFSILTLSAQNYRMEGNNYIPVNEQSSRSSSYIETPYQYKGKQIWINTKNGHCVTRTPSPTRKKADGTPVMNSSPIPEDLAKEIAWKMNIDYTYVRKPRK